MRWIGALALTGLALGGCTHMPWRPYAGWRTWKTDKVTLHTDTLLEYEPALDWLDSAHRVYQSTFFRDQPVPPVEVLYLSEGVASPFMTSSGHYKYGLTIARFGWAEAHGGRGLLVVGYAPWQWHYHHQMAHHFIEATVPHAPLWFHEGFARYLTGFYLLPNRPGVACFGREQPAFTAKVTLPLADLLHASYSEYNQSSEPWVGPLSQALVDYLLHGEQGRLRPRFASLVRELAAGKSSEQALATVYPDLPFADLEAHFFDHVRTVRPPGEECPLPVALDRAASPGPRAAAVKTAMAEADVRALFQGLEQLPDRNGYADFFPDVAAASLRASATQAATAPVRDHQSDQRRRRQ